MPNPEPVEEFVASMPARYVSAFTADEIQQHARIVRARGQRLAEVGRFTSLRHPETAICIVASDRPGLLATISAALSLVGLGVSEAEIFTRRASASLSEAVDLFWVVRQPPLPHLEISSQELERLGQRLVELLGRSEVVLPERASTIVPSAPAASTRVRFVDDDAGRCTTLEVDTNDRSGLLLAICQTIFAARVQIVGSHIKAHGGCARGRFDLLELDERLIATDRRQELQMAVLSAIDELARPLAQSFVG
jgi:[protein-PII] uridylyltransferase